MTILLRLSLWLSAAAFAGDPPPNVWPKGLPYPEEGIPRPEGADPVAPFQGSQVTEAPRTAAIYGTVTERGSGVPVAGGFVTARAPDEMDAKLRAPVGVDGAYRLPLPAGTWVISVESDAHRPDGGAITLRDGDEVPLALRPEPLAFDTIVVYGDPKREEVSRKVITADELLLVPGSFGDPIRALQSLPGVARPSTVEGDIVVRGAEAVNTGTYIDEVPIPYLFHFFIGRSVVNPALIDDVEFFAGGMPSRFGDVTQAIVNARTLDTKPRPGLHGRVSFDLLDFAVSGEARLSDHFTAQGGYRVSWIGGLVGGGARAYAWYQGLGDVRPAYPTISYEDHLARITWESGEDRVTLTALGARDALIFHPTRMDYDGDGDIEDPPTPEGIPYDPWRLMDSGFARYHLRWDRVSGDREQVTWVAAGPDREQSLLQGLGTLADGIDFGRLSGWTIIAKRQDRLSLGNGDAVRFGADALIVPVKVEDYGHIDENGEVPTTEEVRTTVGAWGEYQTELGDTWISPGLRVAGHAFNDQRHVEPEPRVTLRHRLDKHWTGTAFVGRFTQVPPADRYADGIGNPLLTRMTAWQTSIGAEGRWPSGVEVDGTLYLSRFSHLVVKDLKVEMREPAETSAYGYNIEGYAEAVLVPVFQEVDGWSFGLEGMARLRPNGPHFGWVAMSLGRSLRVDSEGTVRPGDYDMPISLTAVYARELPYDLRVSGKLRVTSGYPFTPIYGVYGPDEDEWHGLSGDENADRFPWYRQLDVRADRTWVGERARWIAYVDIFNVTNTKNWMLATYNPNFTEITPTIWMPFFPTIGLEVRY